MKKLLTKKKESLLSEQRELIARLKKYNSPVYNWFVKKGIDFNDLQRQAATFSAAATLLFTTLVQKGAIDHNPLETKAPIVERAEKDQKKKQSDLERGQAVWANYGQMIREAGAKYDVDPNLIFATIMIESGGNPQAIRHEPRIRDASYGLGQLLYGTARGLGYQGKPEGLFDPATNIELIARYHRHNLDHYGHLTAQQLTVAYNTGSPYKKAWSGHLTKFNKWYNRVENLEVDLT